MTLAPLGYARTWLAPLLTDTAEIMRTTTVANAEGGQTEVETLVATVVCRIDASQSVPTERVEGGRVVAVMLFTGYLPAGTDVQPQDVLMSKGERFEVTDDDDIRTDSAVVAVSLRRVE